MAPATKILVATSDADRSDRLVAAGNAGGFETLSGSNAEAVLRGAVGHNPDVIVIDAGMPGLEGFALHQRLSLTGLDLPPIVVVSSDGADLPQATPPRGVYVLSGPESEAEHVVEAVRLVLLADEINGQLPGGMKLLHGDLTRSPFATLIRALRGHVVTGTVSFTGAQISGFAVEDGVVVDAWRGPVRGAKAFNRLSELPSGGFSLAPGRVSDERTLGADLEDLLAASAEERRVFLDSLSKLPTLDARLDVHLTPEFFTQTFSTIERAVLAHAQEVSNLRELLDVVDAVDGDVARAVVSLRDRDLLHLTEPIGRVHVLTDSTADLLAPDARRLGVDVAPMEGPGPDDTADDGRGSRPLALHPVAPGDLPPAGAVSRDLFLDRFRRLAPTGDVLAVVCSSELSASYRHAVAAAADGHDQLLQDRRAAGSSAEPRVLVVDARQFSVPLGMMTAFATRMLAAGMGIETVARKLGDLGRRWRTLMLVPDVEATRRRSTGGGESDAASGTSDRWWLVALEGGAFRVDDSAQVSTAGTMLGDRLLQAVERDRPVFLSLMHASAPAELAALRTLLRARLRVAELWEHQMGPATTRLTGLGAVGAAILQPTADELEVLTERG